MKQELIDLINEKCPIDQGIFFQPYGIPDGIEDQVVYSRILTGGVKGGDCWDGENYAYVVDKEGKEQMEVLDLLLDEVAPDITYRQYKKVRELIHSNKQTHWEYYGNKTDYRVEYILLPELEALLAQFAQVKC